MLKITIKVSFFFAIYDLTSYSELNWPQYHNTMQGLESQQVFSIKIKIIGTLVHYFHVLLRIRTIILKCSTEKKYIRGYTDTVILATHSVSI